MKEYDILKFLLLDIESGTSGTIPVRTEGGDQGANPPEIVVSWDSTRLPDYNGHTPYVGAQTDDAGNATAKEYHSYFTMNADVLVRHEEEFERDKLLSEIHDQFVPYEDDASMFSDDTSQWQIGIAGPRSNSFVEPDWYEAGIPTSFTYVKRTEVTDASRLPGTLDTINVHVNDRTLTVADGEERTIPLGTTRYYEDIEVAGDLIIDGEVYTQSYTTTGTGTITVNGTLYEVTRPYDEIEGITSETLVN